MAQIDFRKIYNFYPIKIKEGDEKLPTGGDVYYECQKCKGLVLSVSFIPSSCGCGNVSANKGKAEVQEPDQVIAMTGKLK